MVIEVIQSEREFKDLKNDWNTLLEKSVSHVPFLRHEYLSSWWSTLGGGEWAEGNLAIITYRDKNNTLQGIAPFFLVNQRLMFLGSFETSDYLDLIATTNKLPAFVNNLVQFLDSPDCPEWKTLDLYNLLADSATIPILKKVCENLNWEIKKEVIQPAPSLHLPESWESYLTNLDDRYRQEIQRKIRKAETYFLPIDWYIVEDETQIERELDSFLELMANNPDKASFLTKKMRAQMKLSALEAFWGGWLQLTFLTVGEIKAAGYLNFDFDHKIWVYNSGINTLFENISPGWVLLSRIIQGSIKAGKSEIDFMRGAEPYKYHFGAADKYVVRIQVSRR
jgi:CelD/BcsL family acetyltransferase involved in cellulose biosynthesis